MAQNAADYRSYVNVRVNRAEFIASLADYLWIVTSMETAPVSAEDMPLNRAPARPDGLTLPDFPASAVQFPA